MVVVRVGHEYVRDLPHILQEGGAEQIDKSWPADNAALERNELGFFEGAGAQVNNDAVTLHWGYVERSNVSMVDQMTEMLAAQRALQSAAQLSKMYDKLMDQASTQVGSLR